ncbi:MAG TPA: hypothetical protein VFN74_05040 [Chloroflexota bacterium]|nr:hypothetical protein [Chloroflexota bacterium]
MASETGTQTPNKEGEGISLDGARAFVYENGALWERALFAQLFEGGDRRQTLRCLAAHQNEDGGWGHALEHDVRTPASSAVVTEFALGVMREFDLADAELVSATARWCVAAQTEEGEFTLGEEFHGYPRAPWWQEARRWPPTAITGRVAAVGAAPPELLERTRRWVERNARPSAEAWPPEGLSVEDLRGLDGESWRYRLYHYADYFLNVPEGDLPKVGPTRDEWRREIVAKAVALAESQEGAECALGWASTPAMPQGAMPAHLIERRLSALAAGQQEDGGWGDAHGLPQWRALSTIWALKALREHGKALVP